MTVKLRLILAFSVLILMAVVIGVVALAQISKIDGSLTLVVDDRVPKMVELQSANQRRVVNERDIARLILSDDPVDTQQALDRIKEATESNAKAFEYLQATIKSDQGIALLNETMKHRKAQSANNRKMVELATSGKKDEALKLYISPETRQLSANYRDSINKFIAYQKLLSQQSSNEGTQAAQMAMSVTIVVLLIALVVGIGFFLWIINVVVRPVVAMQQAMQEVVRTGQFDKQVRVLNRDEIGLSVEALNNLMKSISNAIGESNNTINALAQGDFSKRISGQYAGDLNKLKEGINNSADNVTDVMSQLGRVMESLRGGQFDIQLQTEAQGQYRQMIDTAMGAMGDMNRVIRDINAIMAKVAQGQFNDRVKVQANGEMDHLKSAINDTVEVLENVIGDITQVMDAQTQGDLTRSVTTSCSGQLLQLKDAINSNADNLGRIISGAVNNANVVHGAADEVSRGSQDLSQRVQEQAAALEETSATMDEMNSAVQNNTQNAVEAARVARDVQSKANEGTGVMQQTIAAMNAIQESSHKISDIVSLIDGIAFQTNLLALNAAVEAARAGDHGRGFAVVAGEVRALAQKSAEAAKDIKTLIDESVTRIDQGTKLASESGEVLQGITTAVEHVTQMVDHIAQASREQAEGVNQVHRAISDIDQVTQQNAALVEETSAAAESLSEQATELTQSMAFFKTGQATSRMTARKPAAPKALPPMKSVEEKQKSTAKPPVSKPAVSETDEWSDF